MKRPLLVLSLLFFCAVCCCESNVQTVEEIIEQYLQNTGGATAWANLSSVKMEGKISAQGMDIPIEIAQTKDGKIYMKFQFQAQEITQQAFDGKEAWGMNFMTMKPEKSDNETTEYMKRKIGDFPDPFLNMKSKGYKAELLGKETIEGAECFKVKLTKKPLLVDGEEVENISFYFFDNEDFIPIMVEDEMKTGPSKGITIQTLMSDYQKVEGLYFPFSITEKEKRTPLGQAISITKIELNPTLDPASFAFKE